MGAATVPAVCPTILDPDCLSGLVLSKDTLTAAAPLKGCGGFFY